MCVNNLKSNRKEIKEGQKLGGEGMPGHNIPLGFVKFRTKVV